MRKIIITSVLLFCAFLLNAQDINPFESMGKQGKILTLSNGKYTEVHINDSLQRIGSVIVNMNTGTIYELLDIDTLYSEATLDPTVISRWYSPDPLADKYPSWSPYNFVMNNPILNRDPDGREVVVTVTERENQKPLIEIKVSGAIINESRKTFTQAQINSRMKTFQSEVNGVYNKSFEEFEVKVTLDFRTVNSREEITEADHVISLQDKWTSRNVGGKVNQIGGKIMFLPTQSFTAYKDRTRPHELGHWFGLLHPWDNGFEDQFLEEEKNIMAYDVDRNSAIPVSQFTIESHQVMQIVNLFFGGKLNQGSNTSSNPNGKKPEGSLSTFEYQYDPSNVEFNYGPECEDE